jgi:hypothetical protein
MSKGKGREQQASALQASWQAQQAKANTATDAAAAADPLEEERRQRVKAFSDWESGKSGPVDVRNMPGHDIAISLFNDAKTSRDSGRVGRGLGSISSGANPNYVASLDKEMQMERDVNASGALENYVDNAVADNKAETTGLWQSADARRATAAQLYQGSANAAQNGYFSYLNYLNTRPPSFLKTLALSLAKTGAQAGLALATGGASAAGGAAAGGFGSGLSAGL